MNWHDIMVACKEALDLLAYAYEKFPAPFIAAIVCLSAIPLGYQAAKVIRAIVGRFLRYEVDSSLLMIYATVAAFFIGAWIATFFEALEHRPSIVWFHALAAGLLCAPCIRSSLAKLRERDPIIANAIDHALDTTQEINQQQAGVKPNGG